MIKIKEEHLMLVSGGVVEFGKLAQVSSQIDEADLEFYNDLLIRSQEYIGYTAREIASMGATPDVSLFIFYFGIPDETTRKLTWFGHYDAAKMDSIYRMIWDTMRGN